MRQVEDTHWWYRALHTRVLDALASYAPAGQLAVLDAGCGTGGMLAKLPSEWTCYGLDRSSLALDASRKRGRTQLTQATAACLPYADNSLDAVLLLDVLYHRAVKDPVVVLGEVRRVLRPGAIVVVNVPAYNWLQSSHDRAIHTARRFDRRALDALFVASKLSVVHMTYWNTALLPAIMGLRLLRRWVPTNGSDVSAPSPLMQRIGSLATGLERRAFTQVSLPFGLSLFAVAQWDPE